MERAQHQVPGQRGLDGDLRSFQVANFPEHDHVGVLAQKCAQRPREGHPHRFVHRHLHDSVNVIFDRVLDREQLGINRIDSLETGIKRGRFPAAGRPGIDKNPVGLLDGLDDVIKNVFGKAQRFQLHVHGRAVQHAEHDRFAKLGRQR